MEPSNFEFQFIHLEKKYGKKSLGDLILIKHFKISRGSIVFQLCLRCLFCGMFNIPKHSFGITGHLEGKIEESAHHMGLLHTGSEIGFFVTSVHSFVLFLS